MYLGLVCAAHAAIQLDANETASIAHFRAFPPYLQSSQELPFVGHGVEDGQGYIWFSGSDNLLRYNGYALKGYRIPNYDARGDYGVPFLFRDSQKRLWASNYGLHLLNPKAGLFESFDIFKAAERKFIRAIAEDDQGNFWLAGRDMELLLYNPTSNTVLGKYLGPNSKHNISDVYSIAYDGTNNSIWLSSQQGIFHFNITTKKATPIQTPLDDDFRNFTLRDISLDKQSQTLWVGTQKGLISINTRDFSSKVYSQTHSSYNEEKIIKLDVTTTYLDSANNLWVGLEKSGLCLYRPNRDDFTCMESSVKDPEKLPFATIEDISEDASGSLWLSINNYGAVRVSPNLEKIKKVKDEAANKIDNYFPHTTSGVELHNGEIWFGTDGGGINIFDPTSRSLRNIRHDPENPNSLPSNSVLDLALDEDGNIWAAFWAGGISKINPNANTFKNYKTETDETARDSLLSNNTFAIAPDLKGGVWVGVWHHGLQYLDIASETFTNYDFATSKRDGKGDINNGEVLQIVFYEERVWVVGSGGLEVFDPKTKKFESVISGLRQNLTSIAIDDLENIYLGSRDGLIKLNYYTREMIHYSVEDGLSNHEIFYLTTASTGNLWLATNNGLSIMDKSTNEFRRLYQKDGLVGNKLSTLGNFVEVDNHIYIAAKDGVSIIDPNNVPHYSFLPKTVIESVSSIDTNRSKKTNQEMQLTKAVDPTLPYYTNSLKFELTSISYVFPERNQFKYRFIGWQDDFTYVSANERTIRVTNLKPGNYVFEAFSSNGAGMWDKIGVTYPFTIEKPWFFRWWAFLFYIALAVLAIYLTLQFRLAVSIKRERDLSLKVKEKTHELEKNTLELKKTTDSLADLNTDLEIRVEKRTTELQVEINERKVAESKLFHMAFHDVLTGLPNRQWLIEAIKGAIEKCSDDSNKRFCLMFLDGDRFKHINDTHGHSIGDQLLILAGIRLSNVLDVGQHAARLGGDEFTVFVEGVTSQKTMEDLAARIIDAFKKPFEVDSYKISFNMSIGIVICDSKYRVVSSVLRDADIAMYKAKEQGKMSYKLFDFLMRTETVELAQLEEDLWEAVKKKQFHLVYQPILDISKNKIMGFEALIRWIHPVRGFVSPLDFISIAEENGSIWEIGEWVLDEACRQMKEWHQLDTPFKPMVSVNLSTCQLRNELFISTLDSITTKYDTDTRYLKLELTETMLIENNETINSLIQQLETRGIDLAIDDFGTGYSSLAYLNELKVQYIKIDKKFIDAIDATASGEVNPDAVEIVRATISLGQSLRKKVIAEGIESEQQLEALRQYGCDYAQGYFIDKPLSVEDATDRLTSYGTSAAVKAIKSLPSDPLTRYKKKIDNRPKRRRDTFK